jgi:hypothetical protein
MFKPGIDKIPYSKAILALKEICRTKCESSRATARYITPKFLEYVAAHSGKKLIADGSQLYSRDGWHREHAGSLRQIVRRAVEAIGHPAYYAEVAAMVRKQRPQMAFLTDKQVQGCLARYDEFKLAARGTYGMSNWKIPHYKTHAEAIMELLLKRPGAMQRKEIIAALARNPRYKKAGIYAALAEHPRFVRVGPATYDLRERADKGKSQ